MREVDGRWAGERKEDHNPVQSPRKEGGRPQDQQEVRAQRPGDGSDLHAESLGDAAEMSSCENLGLHPTWQPP